MHARIILLATMTTLASAPSASAQSEFAVLDFVGEVTTVTADAIGSFQASTVGDGVWGEVTLDLSTAPAQGPGNSLLYGVISPGLTAVIGTRSLQRDGTVTYDPLRITDGFPPFADRCDLDFPIRYWDGGMQAHGTARLTVIDADGDAWGSPLIEGFPSPFLVDAAMGRSASLQVLNANGDLMVEGSLSALEIDLRSESRCSPVPNSTGRPGRLRGIGSRVFADNGFSLIGDRLPQDSFGLFLTSLTEGFVANPGGQTGNLCINGQIGRFMGPGQVMSSGSSGTLLLPIDLTHLPTVMGFESTMAGETRYFQLWHRDTSPHGWASNNFTDSIGVAFL